MQGVGFRPFVFRLAKELHVAGSVNNSSAGLFIEAEAAKGSIDTFIIRLFEEKPALSVIVSSEISYLDPVGISDFTILKSDAKEELTALVLPDIAQCEDCRREMNDPKNRRYHYPFINCTNCGPRYSIIQSLPYDRPGTTMKDFALCPDCEREYNDPADRRFHAQPIACPKCGPHVELWNPQGGILSTHDDAIRQTVQLLRDGSIVALKGLGGFQLLVDAGNASAVNELRRRKHRDEKPFALMFASLPQVKQVCSVSKAEEKVLTSTESPIVLLRRKKSGPNGSIADSVAPKNPYLGVMLPYTPLHHLVMELFGQPVVATSGNISDEPMCIDERDALTTLAGIADGFLVHNRPIHRTVDDSVVRIAMNREMIMRRARGYAPLPIMTTYSADAPVLALGGHLKNTIAMQKNSMMIVSQHIGDLETASALESFKKTVNDVGALFGIVPVVVLHDDHPNYASTSHAQSMPMEKESIQHHCAHLSSCMAENELNEPVLGIVWDGTGFGLDGTIWGGEFIEYSGKGFVRMASLRPFSLPGGDVAIQESIRSAVGLIHEIVGPEVFRHPQLHKYYDDKEERVILQMMEKGINAPRTTSMGRLFDGVGALIGLRQRAAFEGQTAMEVEFAAAESTTTKEYPFELISAGTLLIVDWKEMIVNISNDVRKNLSRNDIARKFHNTLVEIIVAVAKRSHHKKIVLTGGCFQNLLLLENSIRRLSEEGFTPYWHQRIPTNDGGISVGQLYFHHLNRKETTRKKFGSPKRKEEK